MLITTTSKINQKEKVEMINQVVLVDLSYPYGKKKAYLSGSLITVAAQLMEVGCQVDIVDLNIENLEEPRPQQLLRQADLIGVSVIGSPYIPSAIEFARKVSQFTQATIMFGGQIIERLSLRQFDKIFAGTNAVQIKNEKKMSELLELEEANIPSWNEVPIAPVLANMTGLMRQVYLSSEMTLVLSQGCKFGCKFCAAAKNRPEVHRELGVFEDDLHYLAEEAKRLGYERLEFYTSALDTFQNPAKLVQYLDVLARVRRETQIDLRVRCLACVQSFLKAEQEYPDLGEKLQAAGLWCIGFGADGTSEEVWHEQGKDHNNMPEIFQCLDVCREMGVRPELLMVMGFPGETGKQLLKTVRESLRFARRWPEVMIRPYLAKPFIPGNVGWAKGWSNQVAKVVQSPRLFFHLDFCALASRLTHPNWRHRWISNFAFLTIIVCLLPLGRCCTFPLFPSGSGGIRSSLAKRINSLMPCDR